MTAADLETLVAPVPPECDAQRFDQALAIAFPQYSRSRLQQWVRAGQATIGGRAARPRDPVRAGELMALRVDPEPGPAAGKGGRDADPLASGRDPEPIALEVVHQDAAVLVINKPPGLVVHPGAGNPNRTLMNALVQLDPRLERIPRAGIVHRLDKDTSGLLVVARTLSAHTQLVRLLAERAVRREYLGVVAGRLTAGGRIEAPVGRHPSRRTHMAVVLGGRPAVTHYRVVERFRAHTLVRVRLETGRTHQIRVHLAHVGHPLVGDPLYAGRARQVRGATPALAEHLAGFRRQALHAVELALFHPVSGELIAWSVEPPADLAALIDVLRTDLASTGAFGRRR